MRALSLLKRYAKLSEPGVGLSGFFDRDARNAVGISGTGWAGFEDHSCVGHRCKGPVPVRPWAYGPLFNDITHDDVSVCVGPFENDCITSPGEATAA